jgi:hypothetical protein
MGIKIMDFELGEIIAQRSVNIEHADGEISVAIVYLGKSRNLPESNDYFTPYQIDFGGDVRLWYAAGIDGFQSLQLAMKMINIELEAFQSKHGVKFSWEGDEGGRLGFDD